MPQMGESLAEGTIVKLAQAAGRRVGHDEPLFEISTDKVDTDVPSPAAGVLAEILVAEGRDGGGRHHGRANHASNRRRRSRVRQSRRPSDTPVAETPEEAGIFKSNHAPQLVRSGAALDPKLPPVPGRAGQARVVLAGRARDGPAARRAACAPDDAGGIRTRRTDHEARRRPISRCARSRGRRGARACGPRSSRRRRHREYLYPPKSARSGRARCRRCGKRIAHHMTWSVRISPHATAFAECDMSGAVATLARTPRTLERRSARRSPTRCSPPMRGPCSARVSRRSTLGRRRHARDQAARQPRHRRRARRHRRSRRAGRATAEPSVARRPRTRHRRSGDSGARPAGSPRGRSGWHLHADQSRRLRRHHRARRSSISRRSASSVSAPSPSARLSSDDEIVIRPMMTMALTFDHRAADGMVAFRFLARVRELLEQLPLGLDSGSSARRDIPGSPGHQ